MKSQTTSSSRPSQTVHDESAEGIELSVVMPCLNEAETLRVCVAKAQKAMREHGIVGEVVIADNGSTDGSAGIARSAGARVVHVEEKGYGNALMAGIRSARGTYVIMGDADDSYDFLHIPRFVDKLREGDDLVMGNRFKGGIEPGAMPPLHRYLGNPVLSSIGRLFFKSPCSDFHCGLRGFRKASIMGLNLQTTGMEFASEVVVKSTIFGLKISEVPTTLSPDGRNRPPHLRSWRDGWRHLRFMSLYCPRWLFFYPGLAMMLVGLFVLGWLLPGSRSVGPLTLDIHTLLYGAAAILIGFQAVMYFVLSKVLGITAGLLPASPSLARYYERGLPEIGMIVGAILVLGGIAGSIFAVVAWGGESFGSLNPRSMIRVAVPAVLAMILGCEMIMSCLYLSLLGMVKK